MGKENIYQYTFKFTTPGKHMISWNLEGAFAVIYYN